MSLISRFDAAEYLTDVESIAAYLADALEHEDARGVVDALDDVVRARGGIERVAGETRVESAIVSRALDTSQIIDFDAVLQVLQGLGVRLSVKVA